MFLIMFRDVIKVFVVFQGLGKDFCFFPAIIVKHITCFVLNDNQYCYGGRAGMP